MIRKLVQTIPDRLAPVFLAGMILAIWQAALLLYLHHNNLARWDVRIELLGTAIIFSFIWIILFIPYIGFRCNGYFSKKPLDSLHPALKSSMEVVFASITWTLIYLLGEPLVSDNILSQSHLHILSVILAILSIFMVRLIPEQSTGRIRNSLNKLPYHKSSY